MGEVEKQLRSNRASFADVRALSPTRYRFRVVDANGVDIIGNYQYPKTRSEDTRVSCAEPVTSPYSLKMGGFKRLSIGSTFKKSTLRSLEIKTLKMIINAKANRKDIDHVTKAT